MEFVIEDMSDAVRKITKALHSGLPGYAMVFREVELARLIV